MKHKEYMKACHDLRVWITRHPGCSKDEIEERTGSTYGLFSLVKMGYVHSKRQNGSNCYYASAISDLSECYSFQEKFALKLPHPDEILADAEHGPSVAQAIK